ncbi:hypothetical protein BZU93_29715, partial [Salmonella enterica subsp. enterica]|nr:hypothetical protein [Salmonella enterica subsp. enterica serovar Enteritidis]
RALDHPSSDLTASLALRARSLFGHLLPQGAKEGRSAFAGANGLVVKSMTHLTAEDRAAIAAYLKAVPGRE